MSVDDAVKGCGGELAAKVLQLLRWGPLCDWCLGRMFAALGRGWVNGERGAVLKKLLVMCLHGCIREGSPECREVLESIVESIVVHAQRLLSELKVEARSGVCKLCGGVVPGVYDRAAAKAVELLRSVDASTFLVAAHVAPELRRVEEELKIRFKLKWAESIAAEARREVSKRIQAVSSMRPDFDYPDAVVEVYLPSGEVRVRVHPILIGGRYWKLARRVAQSYWPYHGGVKKYPFSVEEALLPLLDLYEASEVVLHAAGREDVDVRMLGTGRPMVVEVRGPRRRRVPLRDAETRVNEWARGLVEFKFERSGLKRRDVEEVKGEKARHVKVYRALVYSPETELSEDDVRRLEEFFRDRLVRQRTPRRVRHRRPDVVRERMVYEVRGWLLAPRTAEFLVKCDGGLYVKELISGDEGDTEPSFTSVLGKPLYCVELDVLAIQPWGSRV